MAREAPVAATPTLSSCEDDCRAEAVRAELAPSLTVRRIVLTRRVRLLVAATIGYNVIEAVVAIAAGTVAGSTALIGFGLDSVIEVSSAVVVAWQFRAPDPEAREQIALRLIACSFFVLAAYLTVESTRALIGSSEVDHSTVGIVFASVSLLVMPFLSYLQRRAGRNSARRLRSLIRSRRCCARICRQSCWWSRAQQPVRLVVGRSAGRTRHRRRGRQGGPRHVEGRRLLHARRLARSVLGHLID